MFAPLVAKTQTKESASSSNKQAHKRSTQEFAGSTVEQILFLQRTIGNQATLRLLSQRAARDHAVPAQAKSPLTVSPLPGVLQPKLKVGAVDDPLEREADRVAEHVMRMPDPGSPSGPALSAAVSTVQRKCSCGGSCHQCKSEQSDDEHARLQMKSTGAGVSGHTSAQSVAPPIVHEVLRSPGQPLDPATRAFFELRFGHDFSKIRVHADAEAAQSAEAVQAHAYTVGREIVFGPGRYDPHIAGGRNLLAHELAHTIQQAGVPSSNQGLAVGQEPTMSKGGVAVPEKSTSAGPSLQRQPKPNVKDKPQEVKPQSPSTPTDNCQYSIKYTTPAPVDIADYFEQTKGKPSTNYLCGAVLMYDILSVSATGKGCPKTLDGLKLTEDVNSKATCGDGKPRHWDTGTGTLSADGKCDKCKDTFALLVDPERPWQPNIHCTEVLTQKLFVGGKEAETHHITWHMDTDKAGKCTANVDRK